MTNANVMLETVLCQSWCSGTTQRDGMGWGGRWDGGSGWGDTGTPVADSC